MLGAIWDHYLHRRMKVAEVNAVGAKEVAITTGTAISEVNNQLETLVLANQAMWELLSEKAGLTETDLINKMNEVDLRDGKLDGKIEKTVVRECGTAVTKSLNRELSAIGAALLYKRIPHSQSTNYSE